MNTGSRDVDVVSFHRPWRHRAFAGSWASAGEKDSAFGYLNNIINTDYNVFIDFPEINEDNYLLLLHGDERWQPLLDAVRKNWSWIKTTHSFTGPDIPMIATVDQASTFLKSDGKGSYKSGVDKVNCVDQHAYNLQLSGHAVWYLSGDRTNLSSRFVILDLKYNMNSMNYLIFNKCVFIEFL